MEIELARKIMKNGRLPKKVYEKAINVKQCRGRHNSTFSFIYKGKKYIAFDGNSIEKEKFKYGYSCVTNRGNL